MRAVTAGNGLKSLLVSIGFDRLLGRMFAGCGAILMFHRIRDHDAGLMFEPNHRNMVAPALFCALLDTLAATGVAVVSLEEALDRLRAKRGGRFVSLTFDDGYADNHDILLPIVVERALPVTVYVAPGLVDGTAPLWWYGLDHAIARATSICLPMAAETALPATTAAEKQMAFAACAAFMLQAKPGEAARFCQALADRHGIDFSAIAAAEMMDWRKVRAMAACKWVEIGAHTLSHPPLSRLDEAGARQEMAASRERLEAETGRRVVHFAYPFGTPAAVGTREVRLAADCGFATAVATDPGNLFAGHLRQPHDLPRHGIGPLDGPAALRLKLAGATRGLFAASKRRNSTIAPATA